MVIIDPDMDGCIIWKNGSRQRINGTPKECARRILESNLFDGPLDDVFVDATGVGMAYEDAFKQFDIGFKRTDSMNVVK